LLLFFHHVAYTHVLHSGKTVIQHVYDAHYAGADQVGEYVSQWKLLKGHVDDDRYADVLNRLQYQAEQAMLWRDTIDEWFYGVSGIDDTQERLPRKTAHLTLWHTGSE
jgi:alpha-glucuronidase